MIKMCILGQKPDGTPDFNKRYWLAGDPCKTQAQHSGVADESRSITRQSQREGGAGWAFTRPVDRAGEGLTLQFATTRLFDSIVECWRWRNAMSALDPADWPHPIEGDCLMRFELPDGTHEEARLYDCLVGKPMMKAEGESLQLSYGLQGGRIEPHASGLLTVIPFAHQYFEDSVQMALFASAADGDFDNADTVYSGSISRSLAVGERLGIVMGDNYGTVIVKEFEVVNEGGSAGGGRIPITHPVVSHLDMIADAFAAESALIRCFVETSGSRPYVYLGWKNPPISDPAEVPLNITVFDNLGNSIYEAGSKASAFNLTGRIVIPVASFIIPTAAIPTP